MSFGHIIEQVLRQGMAGQSRARLEHSVGPQGLGGVPGLGELLGAVLGGRASGRPASGGGLGDVFGGNPPGRASTGGLEDLLGGMLGGATRGAGGAGGGLGDLLGGILGGGRAKRSGSGSGAGMAILATIAMAALKNWSQSRGPAGLDGRGPEHRAGRDGRDDGAGDRAARAAGDGSPRPRPTARSTRRRSSASSGRSTTTASARPRRSSCSRSCASRSIFGDWSTPCRARPWAQVYGASLFVIKVDTEAEADYLQQLAGPLGLDAGTVTRLHELTGAPAV